MGHQTSIGMNYTLIEDEAALDNLCNALEHETQLAIDTEFFRETTYFPSLGLVQIAGNNHIACVDPLVFDAKNGLARLLLNPAITKVFHACTQDLEVLYQYLGALPCPLEDTQIAAALLGEKDQIGYANLVFEQMGIQLDKSETRTNWLKRPLTSRQLEYAANDVRHLLPLHKKLGEELESNGRGDWLKNECNKLCQSATRFQPDFDNCWLRVKGSRKLSDSQLAIVDSVAQWREHVAIKKDLTRRKIIPDELIVNLAVEQPCDIQALAAIDQISNFLDSEEMSFLVNAISEGRNKTESEWPSGNRVRLSSEEKNTLNSTLNLINLKATELGIAPNILCPRKDASKLVLGERELPVLQDWRLNIIGNSLLSSLPDR